MKTLPQGAYRLLPLAPCPWQRNDPEWAHGSRWWIVPEDWGDRPFPGNGFPTIEAARQHAQAHNLNILDDDTETP